jgi:hypothetical protein
MICPESGLRVVSRRLVGLLGRVIALALVGVTGMLADARPAQAMGCHVPDRPVLAMTISLQTPDVASILPPSRARLTRLPCSQEIPGSSQSQPPLPTLAIVDAAEFASRPRPAFSVPESTQLRPRNVPLGRERPPR